MSLDDIAKIATGSGFSFLAGVTWGYNTTAHHDKAMKTGKALKLKGLLDYGLMTMWGIIPQNWCHHENPGMLLSAYIGGIAGAVAGKIVGRKLGHSRTALNA